MTLPDVPPLNDLVRELIDFLVSDTLRNFLASGRVLAELARLLYHHVVTAARVLEGAAHTSQGVTTRTSAILHPAGGE